MRFPATANTFARESHIDELAYIAGADPLRFRLRHLDDERLTDLPELDVVLLDRPDLPSAGAGETPLIAVAPAIANAIFAATGRRLHSLPLTPEERAFRPDLASSG